MGKNTINKIAKLEEIEYTHWVITFIFALLLFVIVTLHDLRGGNKQSERDKSICLFVCFSTPDSQAYVLLQKL